MRDGIETEAADLDARAARAAPQQRARTLSELGEREGLGDVVVATCREPGDALGHGVARRQEDHRHGVATAAHRRADVAAVGIGQADVEDQQVRAARVVGAQELDAVCQRLDLEAFLAQTANDELA